MWVKKATRRELIDVVQGERLPVSERLFPGHEFSAVSSLASVDAGGDLILVWQEDPRETLGLPNLIVTGEDERDFLAWASSFLNVLNPLTAYVRVTTHQTAIEALKLHAVPELHRLESACAGLILGEIATYLDSQRDLKRVAVRACIGTYSLVMARSLALGALTLDSDRISDSWFEARELTRQSSLSMSKPVLYAPWRVLLGLEGGGWPAVSSGPQLPRWVLDLCLDLYVKGEVDGRQWHSLESEIRDLEGLGTVMRGPREERVVAFERVADQLRESSANPVVVAFTVGYLASQIAPGTLEHLHVVSPHVHAFPGVLMWYGMCAGLHGRSGVTSYAGGLGRRAICVWQLLLVHFGGLILAHLGTL